MPTRDVKTRDSFSANGQEQKDLVKSLAAFGGGVATTRFSGKILNDLLSRQNPPSGWVTAADVPTLERLVPHAQLQQSLTDGAFYQPSSGIVNVGPQPSKAIVSHELGHAQVYGAPEGIRRRVVQSLDTPGRAIIGNKAISIALVLSYSDKVLDSLGSVLGAEDKKSITSQIIEWYKLNRGKIVGTAAGLTLLNEALASIVGAYMAKKHLGVSYRNSLKEMFPAFMTYVGALGPHIYASHIAAARTRNQLETKTAGANTSLVVLFADDIADLAIQGYRMRHLLPINHKTEPGKPVPVEIAPPKQKLAMMGGIGAIAAGSGIGAGLGAFIGGPKNRLLGAGIGAGLGVGAGLALKKKTPTYGQESV